MKTKVVVLVVMAFIIAVVSIGCSSQSLVFDLGLLSQTGEQFLTELLVRCNFS